MSDALHRCTRAAGDAYMRILAACARQTGVQNQFRDGKRTYTLCAGRSERLTKGGGLHIYVEHGPRADVVGSFVIQADGTVPFFGARGFARTMNQLAKESRA